MTIQLTTPAHLRPSQHSDTHVIAFLGTGRMGAPMAANLARAGFEVRVRPVLPERRSDTGGWSPCGTN
jgi:3-hydroxyisobutyrate dehydrogenase